MKIIYFVRKFLEEIITTIIGIIGSGLAWKYQNNLPLQKILPIIVIIMTFFVVIYFRNKKRKIKLSALTEYKDKEVWMGDGKFELDKVQKAYEITNASLGYIHSELLNGSDYSDYMVSFDFKIANKCLGVIVRAKDLSNYVMLQISLEAKGIRPHILENKEWKFIQEAKDANLYFSNVLELAHWYKCKIYCNKKTITIRIWSTKWGIKKKLLFDQSWDIPNNKISIALDSGSIGFRNFGNEKAFIKNVLVKNI